MSIITGRRLKCFRDDIVNIFANKSKYGDSIVSVGRKSDTTVGDGSAVLGGNDNTASGARSAVLGGNDNTASGARSVVLGGNNNKASGLDSAILGGSDNTTDSDSVILGGISIITNARQLATGHYNNNSLAEGGPLSGTGAGTALCIGNGVPTARSNAVRINYNGKMFCKAAYSSTGADYAELFEWLDKNLNNEVRYGYFVTMVGTKIMKANAGDWILGIVSANPCILGNSDMEWQGQFMKDEFGAFIMEDIVVTEKRLQPKLGENGEQVYEQVPITDAAGNPLFDKNEQPAYTEKPVFEEVEVEVPCQFYKVNPDYDPDQEYIERISRPEWDAIGMMGVLSVYDDGSCQVDGYCTVADGGIATASAFGYRVIERVTENIVKVIINAESSNMVLALMNRINLLEQQINELSA